MPNKQVGSFTVQLEEVTQSVLQISFSSVTLKKKKKVKAKKSPSS